MNTQEPELLKKVQERYPDECNAKSLGATCREMTVRELLEQKCKDLQHQAYQINELIKALPSEMSQQAESALRRIINNSK